MAEPWRARSADRWAPCREFRHRRLGGGNAHQLRRRHEDPPARCLLARDAADCADCESKNVRIDRIEREIGLKGDLCDEQRNGLLAIAEKCPVHRTLISEIRIHSRLSAETS